MNCWISNFLLTQLNKELAKRTANGIINKYSKRTNWRYKRTNGTINSIQQNVDLVYDVLIVLNSHDKMKKVKKLNLKYVQKITDFDIETIVVYLNKYWLGTQQEIIFCSMNLLLNQLLN